MNYDSVQVKQLFISVLLTQHQIFQQDQLSQTWHLNNQNKTILCNAGKWQQLKVVVVLWAL